MSEIKGDQLLECLVIFTKLKNNPYSADALIAGLPTNKDGKVELFSQGKGKSLFSRAAKRAGFASSLNKEKLENITPLVLPCIIMLRDNRAAILHSVDLEKKKARITTPQVPDGVDEVDLDVLNEEYLGFCWYLKPEFIADDTEQRLEKQGGHWFWGTLQLSKKIYTDVIWASIVINLFVLASPLFTMNVYDRVVPNNATDTLWVLAIGVGVVYIFDLALKFIRTYFLDIAGKKSDIIMSSILFEKVMDLSYNNRPRVVGSFANNLREFDVIRNFFTSGTIALLIDLPFSILFIIVTYFIAGNIIFIPVAFMILILIYTLSIRKPLEASIKSTFEASAKKNGILIEALNGLETIKTMGSSGHVQYTWEEATGEIANKSIKTKILSASVINITQFLIQINTIAIVVAGVYLIKDMHLTMGGLIAATILGGRAIAPMASVAGLLSNYEQTKTAFDGLQKIMDMPTERHEGKKFVRRNTFNGNIEFKNVSFAYHKDGKLALDHMSFKIKAGDKVAIIGKNGSGKTTIEKMILGLYRPTEGSVLIDGIDINQIDPVDLRRNIGYVPQDVVLFNGTARSNILYKAPYVDDEALLRAAKISGVDEYVNLHPQGFDMPIEERGDGISGGQRQSIAIARAFLLDSPIVLLDEPTNSLDSQTETRLKENLKVALEGKTLLLVTHKMDLLELVDKIIVVENGKLLLAGPKNDVLNYMNKIVAERQQASQSQVTNNIANGGAN